MLSGLRILECLLLGFGKLALVKIDGVGLLGRDAGFAETCELGEERLLGPLCRQFGFLWKRWKLGQDCGQLKISKKRLPISATLTDRCSEGCHAVLLFL